MLLVFSPRADPDLNLLLFSLRTQASIYICIWSFITTGEAWGFTSKATCTLYWDGIHLGKAEQFHFSSATLCD